MQKKILHFLIFSVICVMLAACGNEKNVKLQKETYADEDFDIEHTGAVKDIYERGYLIVGCKDDVPGFAYYNKDTQMYEGGEIELAYYIAAKIFDVSVEDAKEKNLVHFNNVTVETRESVLLDGEADYVIATFSITEDRAKRVAFSKCYYKDSVGLMIMSQNKDEASLSDKDIRNVADLDGKKIGVKSGSTTREDMLDYMQKNSISISPCYMEYKSYSDMNIALEKGDIDVFCVDRCILNGYKDESKEILPDKFSFQKYGVASSINAPELTTVADKVIDELEYKGINLF